MSAKLEIPNARNLIDEYLSGKPVGEMLKREGFSQIVFNRLLREFGVNKGAYVSSYEIPLLECLTRYGVNAVHQQAIGTCNIDIGIPDSRIAVEVERRYFGESKSLRRERVENIISAGWRIIVVYDPMCNGIAYDTVAKNIATVSKLVSLNPSIYGKYGVIRGHGKYSARPSFDLYGLPRIFGL
jgi:hypothetical protein